MINHDFKIDFENKKISYQGKSGQTYTVTELYSFLMDIFDEPENMQYEIPIIAHSKTSFELINGRTIDKKSLKHLKGALTQGSVAA